MHIFGFGFENYGLIVDLEACCPVASCPERSCAARSSSCITSLTRRRVYFRPTAAHDNAIRCSKLRLADRDADKGGLSNARA